MTNFLANPAIDQINPYQGGLSIDAIAKKYNISREKIIKLASNENPLGASPQVVVAASKTLQEVCRYPDGEGNALRNALAEKNSLTSDNIILGNGSNEIIDLLSRYYLSSSDTAVITTEYSFVVYKMMAQMCGAQFIEIAAPGFLPYDEAIVQTAEVNTQARIVFLACPNNPTGTLIEQYELDFIVENLPPYIILCIDEAYFEYVEKPLDTLQYVRAGRNVCVLRTFSKAYGLAGLRIGYGMAPSHIIKALNRARQPFNVNAIAQSCAMAALNDTQFLEKTVTTNRLGIEQLEQFFEQKGINFVRSHANFMMVEFEERRQVFEKLLAQGIITRGLKNYNLPDWLRITIGTSEQNEQLITALKEII